MSLFTGLRRVAFIGLPNSGKTVLLTSLLMHLQNLSPALTDGSGKQLDSFLPRHRKGTIGQGLKEFRFEQYRKHLAEHGVFPEKTFAESEFSFDVKVSGWEYQVDMLDVPGERFFDIEMFGQDYSTWCDELESLWEREHHPAMSAYLETISSDSCLEQAAVVAAYRNLLAHLVAEYRTSITPSTFRLSRDGKCVRGRTGHEILESAATNPCGLTLDTQFAPLFRPFREKHKELATKFSQHFEEYRAKVVEPLFSELALCDRLVFLIDVPHLLAAANGAWDDQDHLIKKALQALVPKQGAGRTFGRFVRDVSLEVAALPRMFWDSFQKLRPGRVKKVAFVATKSDLIVAKDTNRLSHLLSSLVGPQKSFLCGIKPKTFILSAVKSTVSPGVEDNEDVGYLTGRLQWDYSTTPPSPRSPRDPKIDYNVSRLPNEWPLNWEPHHYSFPPVYPDIPKLKIVSPPQENLNELFKFMIEK